MKTEQKITALAPFGALVAGGGAVTELDIGWLQKAVLEHRVVVLRGFEALDRGDFEAFAARFGAILRWNFGAVLDVVVDGDAKNYLFTSGSVPHHWDGAFAEKVPFLQIFQCLAAPNSSQNQGGETVFCDTTRLWNAASPQQQARWNAVEITYHTEKIAHYGGEICADLVSRHPISGQTTLRFAEPPDAQTAPLNPLFLEADGAPLDELLRELQPLLYSPQFCYVHDWHDGDFILADNHALLHARRAFSPGAKRHLQRIHIQ